MQRLELAWTCHCMSMRNWRTSRYIGCHAKNYKLCLFMHQIHIGQAPQYLSDCVSTVSAASGVADTSWGRSAELFTFCQEQELDLENVVSSTPVQPPGTTFLPTFATLLTPVHSENDWRAYFLIVFIPLTTVGAPGRVVYRRPTNFTLIDWLIDWLIDQSVSHLFKPGNKNHQTRSSETQNIGLSHRKERPR